MQKIVPVLQDAFCTRVSLVGAVSACRAGLDKEIKEVFKDCKGEGKRSFWHLVSIPYSQMEDCSCSFLILHESEGWILAAFGGSSEMQFNYY